MTAPDFGPVPCADDLRFISTDPRDRAEAVAVCHGCDFRAECRKWAESEDFEGVAGGLIWKGRGKLGNRTRLPSELKYAHWSEEEMRLANREWCQGIRTAWANEGRAAYTAWRKRLSRERVKAA